MMVVLIDFMQNKNFQQFHNKENQWHIKVKSDISPKIEEI